MAYGATISESELREFKSTWPCHGINERIVRFWCEWDSSNGDLIDIKAFYRNGREVRDSALYDGPAALALVNDKQREMHPEHSR